MGCSSKIDSFFSKARKLNAGLSYAVYKELQFGNTEEAEKYEKSLQDIKSISWLLKKHEYSTCDCNKHDCLCPGAASNPTYNLEEFISDTLDVNGPPTTFPELWKGVLYNKKSKQVISVSSRSLDVYDSACELALGSENPQCRLNPNTHKSLRFWSWEDNVPTLLFDTGEVFDGIAAFELVSFYYSELHDSYYLKVNSDSGATTGPVLIKVNSSFSSVQVFGLNGVNVSTANDPSPVLMELSDSLNYIFIKRDDDNIDVHSLVDLTVIKTIDTTGFPYQKMTWNDCDCNLILTGSGDAGDAVIHVVDHIAGTVTNKLNSSSYKNNTSIITNDGNLLVLTRDESTFTMAFQKWTACDDMKLISTVNTGLLMGAANPGFITIHSLIEDKDGNIFVVYLPLGQNVTLAVFDKDLNLKFQRDLGVDFGSLGDQIPNSWTNDNINNSQTNLIIHNISKNGVGGLTSYYLDYDSKSLERIKPKCIELTSEEISVLVNKINYIKVPKAYKSLGLNTNIKNIKDCNRLFVYQQETPAVLWTINHNLNTFPVIIAVDNQGNKITGLETYVSKNTVTILFSIPVAGTAYLTYNIQ
jgi:hypothetical protein